MRLTRFYSSTSDSLNKGSLGVFAFRETGRETLLEFQDEGSELGVTKKTMPHPAKT
jgi:hypothetical protein